MLPQAISSLKKRLIRRRKIHCFCLGAAKTGTTSLAEMFKLCYRSAHEPETVALTEAVARVLNNSGSVKPALQDPNRATSCGDFDVAAWLLARDRRLNLEVEASHPLGYMAPWLPRVFPDARFLITLRDPLPWLKSRLNFHLYKSPPEWRQYRDLIWGRWHRGYAPEEKHLEGLGLYSIDAYLAQYAEQYRMLFRNLPAHRRQLVKTEELDTSLDKIAAFLEIEPTSISRRHANAMPREESVIDQLPTDFVAARIQANCQWMSPFL